VFWQEIGVIKGIGTKELKKGGLGYICKYICILSICIWIEYIYKFIDNPLFMAQIFYLKCKGSSFLVPPP